MYSHLSPLIPCVNTPSFLFKTFVLGGGGVFLKIDNIILKKFLIFSRKLKKIVKFILEKPFSKIYPNSFVNRIAKFVKKIIHRVPRESRTVCLLIFKMGFIFTYIWGFIYFSNSFNLRTPLHLRLQLKSYVNMSLRLESR